MAIFEITCEYEFEAGHYLPHVPPSHKCSRQHGHNYVVELTMRGPAAKPKEFVADFGDIDALWAKHVHEKLDHRNLNDVGGLENPTAERLAWWIYWRLHDHAPLIRVRVRETRRYSASYGESS